MIEKLSDTEKSTLERITRKANKLLVKRANIILLSDQRVLPADIAKEVELTPRTVRHWQKEFNKKRLDIFPANILGNDRPEASEEPITTPPQSTETAPPPTSNTKPDVKKIKRQKGDTIKYPVRKKVGLKPTDTMAEAGRKVIGFHFARMLKHEPGTRLGEDIEELHDMRVATRRMRAAFNIFGSAFSKKKIKSLQRGLQATARALGRVRDLDVFMEKLQHYQQSLPEEEHVGLEPLLETWRKKGQPAREQMLVYLDSKEYVQFKQNMLEFVKTEGLGAKPVPTGVPVPYQLRHIVPRLIYERYEAVCAYETVLDNASLETLHQLRLTFKEFRYTLEYFREILGPEREMVIKEVKVMQDYLGDLNDADVAGGILRDFLADWEEHQLHRPLSERQSPVQVVAYLNSKLEERHQLIVNFPQTWARFNRPEFRRNLALAVAAL